MSGCVTTLEQPETLTFHPPDSCETTPLLQQGDKEVQPSCVEPTCVPGYVSKQAKEYNRYLAAEIDSLDPDVRHKIAVKDKCEWLAEKIELSYLEGSHKTRFERFRADWNDTSARQTLIGAFRELSAKYGKQLAEYTKNQQDQLGEKPDWSHAKQA